MRKIIFFEKEMMDYFSIAVRCIFIFFLKQRVVAS